MIRHAKALAVLACGVFAPAVWAADALTGEVQKQPLNVSAIAMFVAFVAFMLLVGRRVIPWTLEKIAATGSRELFTLSVLAIALGVAFGSAMLFGVSFALGAFFAGMLLNESELSHKAANDSLPLRDAFAVLFFVSVGMLFNPMIVVEHPWQVLATFLIIVVGKSIAAGAEIMTRLTQNYGKPAFGLKTTTVGDETVAVNEEILLRDVIDLEATQGGAPGEAKAAMAAGVSLPAAHFERFREALQLADARNSLAWRQSPELQRWLVESRLDTFSAMIARATTSAVACSWGLRSVRARLGAVRPSSAAFSWYRLAIIWLRSKERLDP